jgi:ADP-ribosylglycohydrolase
VPAALALSLLAKGDPETAIIYGANFGRDTDTIACMAGYICGAYAGLSAPASSKITLNDNVVEESAALAASLLAVGQQKASTEIAAWQLLSGSALS